MKRLFGSRNVQREPRVTLEQSQMMNALAALARGKRMLVIGDFVRDNKYPDNLVAEPPSSFDSIAPLMKSLITDLQSFRCLSEIIPPELRDPLTHLPAIKKATLGADRETLADAVSLTLFDLLSRWQKLNLLDIVDEDINFLSLKGNICWILREKIAFFYFDAESVIVRFNGRPELVDGHLRSRQKVLNDVARSRDGILDTFSRTAMRQPGIVESLGFSAEVWAFLGLPELSIFSS